MPRSRDRKSPPPTPTAKATPPPPAAPAAAPPPAPAPADPQGATAQLVRHTLRSWTAKVRPALMLQPTENNLLISLGDWGHPQLRLVCAHASDGAPEVAVGFTPEAPAVIARIDPKISPERAAQLIRRAEPSRSWPAVQGPADLIDALVPLLQESPTIGGGPLLPRSRQRWMEARSLKPAADPGGWLRVARRLDIGTLLPMVLTFSAETGEQDDTAEADGALAWLRPRVEAGAVWVWERPTTPVAGVRRGGIDDPGEHELVGMVVRSPATAGRVRLSSVFTRGQDRAKGYAAAMVAAITADSLKQTNVHGVILLVDSANEPARRLYERLGYEARGEQSRWERRPTI